MVPTVLVVFFSVFTDPATSLVGAFLSGLLVDIWHGETLGYTSTIYVVISLLLNLYKRKFNAGHIVFLLPFTIFVLLATAYIHNDFALRQERIISLSSTATVITMILWLLIRLWRRYFEKDHRHV